MSNLKELNKNFIIELSHIVSVFLELANPYICMLYALYAKQVSRLIIFLPIIILLIECMLMKFYEKNTGRKEGEFPKLEKRFTFLFDNGDIGIQKEDIYEIIRYLRRVEDFMENTGRIKDYEK